MDTSDLVYEVPNFIRDIYISGLRFKSLQYENKQGSRTGSFSISQFFCKSERNSGEKMKIFSTQSRGAPMIKLGFLFFSATMSM